MNTVISFMSLRIRSLSLLVSAAIVLLVAGGCAFLKPAKNESRYHVLTATSSPSVRNQHDQMGPAFVVCLRPVEVANYLATRDMVVRTGTNEVTYALFQRWAEPLNAGIGRVLAENLRASPEIRVVITDQPAPAHRPLYTIWVRVLACEGSEANHHGSTVFEAAWEITQSQPEPTTLAHGVFRSKPTDWHRGDYNQLAHQLSRALGDFSQVLVNAISQQTGSHASS